MDWVKWSFTISIIFAVHELNAQKWWDGEGKDSLWSNSKNWYPDGVPQSSDDVIIDNSKITGGYKVLIN